MEWTKRERRYRQFVVTVRWRNGGAAVLCCGHLAPHSIFVRLKLLALRAAGALVGCGPRAESLSAGPLPTSLLLEASPNRKDIKTDQ
jgi:hypothetical protein